MIEPLQTDSALLWGRSSAFYVFPEQPEFEHARLPCEPLPMHWDGLTTAAIAVRVDLEHRDVSLNLRWRLKEIATFANDDEQFAFLCEDRLRSQHKNRAGLLERLRELAAAP